MPHRNRTLMMVMTLICVFVVAAILVSAAVRSAGDEAGHDHAALAFTVAEAPPSVAANHPASVDHRRL